MNTRSLLSVLTLGTLVAAGTPAAFAQAGANPETALQQVLERGAAAFNQGDFAGYLADFAPQVRYNELQIQKNQLVSLNGELKQTFADLHMHYDRIAVRTLKNDEAIVSSVAKFEGSTPNYEQSGLPASYEESGEVSALYHFDGRQWQTNELRVAWNDSTINVGEPFGVIGLTALPTLVGAGQPYTERLWVGDDLRPGVEVEEAYAVMPLTAAIDKNAADQAFKALKFQPVASSGIQTEMHAPDKPGTYVHLVVLNKFAHTGEANTPLAQKVFTRLVHVE